METIHLEMILYVSVIALAGAVTCYAAWRLARSPVSPTLHWLIAGLALCSYLVVFSVLSMAKFDAYNMGMLDLGGIDQSIWNTLHGRPFQMTSFDRGDINRLGIHVEPLHLLVSPIFLIWDSAKALLLLQTLSLCIAAIPLAAMARTSLSTGGACSIVLSYLLYPPLAYANLSDYHPDTLAVPLLATALWAYERRRAGVFCLTVVLAMGTKEYVPLLVGALGLLAVIEGRKLWGTLTILLAAAWFFVALQVVIPAFSEGRDAYYLTQHYRSVGGGSGLVGVLGFALREPVAFVSSLFSWTKLGYCVLLLAPVWGLALGAPLRLLVASPILFILLLHPGVADIRNHHSAIMIPIITWAVIGALESAQARHGERVARSLMAGLLTASVTAAVLFGPSPLAYKFWTPTEWGYHAQPHNYKKTPHDHVLDRISDDVPKAAPGSVSVQLGAHFSHRATLYTFPYPYSTTKTDSSELQRVAPDWVLIDVMEAAPQAWLPVQPGTVLQQWLADPAWQIIHNEDGILMGRTADSSPAGEPFRIERSMHFDDTRAMPPGAHPLELELTSQVDRARLRLVLACAGQQEPAVVVVTLRGTHTHTRILDWMSYPTSADSLSSVCGDAPKVVDVIDASLPADLLPAEVTIGVYRVSDRYPLATEENEQRPWWNQFIVSEQSVGLLNKNSKLVWQSPNTTP